MKWIRVKSSQLDHAVPHGAKKSLCGIPLARAVAIMPRPETRCQSCDNLWREAGRMNKPKRVHVNVMVFYTPRFTFERDFSDERA